MVQLYGEIAERESAAHGKRRYIILEVTIAREVLPHHQSPGD
jgi:hypothetical protein